MKRIAFFILIALLSMAMSGISRAETVNGFQRDTEISRLRAELPSARTAADSIKILYDLLDLSKQKDQLTVGRELYDVAARSGKTQVALDVARITSMATNKYDAIPPILDAVRELPESKERRETELFLKIREEVLRSVYLPEKERQAYITELMARDDYDSLDEHGKILRLFTICSYLGNYVKGDLLVGYIDHLGKLLEQADIDLYAIYNTYYTTSANIYTYTENRQKAINVDRKLLDVIAQLQAKYEREGRKYRDYSRSKYIVYRRMLSNYEALPTEDVNKYYAKIQKLAASNAEISADMEARPRPTIYYLVENGRFKEAIPLIEQQLKYQNSVPVKRQLLQLLIEAAKRTGDQKTLLSATARYTDSMEEWNAMNDTTRISEYKIREHVGRMRTENTRMELERRDSIIDATRSQMTFVIIGWIIFAILLAIMLSVWGKFRRAMLSLGKFVKHLAKERDTIKGKLYSDYTPTDNYDSLRHLPKDADGMMNFVINDFMYISSIGKENILSYIHNVDARHIMEEAVEKVNAYKRESVRFNVVYPETKVDIKVDRECLAYLMDHILRVAERMTPEGGKMGLEFGEVKSLNLVKFVFTHTGDSLPYGKEEKIFDNFINLQELTERDETGLFICRMINFLINGSLKADRNYREGGCLIFYIPVARQK